MLEDTQSRQMPQSENTKSTPAIHFDWRDWEHFLEEAEGSVEEKRELIETVQKIVLCFVDAGFALNPSQQICGEDIDLTAILMRDVVKSKDQSKPAFNAACVQVGKTAQGGRS